MFDIFPVILWLNIFMTQLFKAFQINLEKAFKNQFETSN